MGNQGQLTHHLLKRYTDHPSILTGGDQDQLTHWLLRWYGGSAWDADQLPGVDQAQLNHGLLRIYEDQPEILTSYQPIDSLWPSGAIWYDKSGSELVQIIFCWLFSAKPLSEPVQIYHWSDPQEQTEIENEILFFFFTKCIWKCCLQNSGHCVQASPTPQRISLKVQSEFRVMFKWHWYHTECIWITFYHYKGTLIIHATVCDSILYPQLVISEVDEAWSCPVADVGREQLPQDESLNIWWGIFLLNSRQLSASFLLMDIITMATNLLKI